MMTEPTIMVDGQSFVPRYSGEDYRSRKRESVVQDKNGTIKSIYLEGIRKIHTPIGDIRAEYITFYPTGAIKRVFPSFGQISGFWSEEEEMALVEEMEITVYYQKYKAKYSCIHFYESGAVKSLTLYPKENITVKTIFGKIKVRNGISFYENGKIQSLEPATYTSVNVDQNIYIAYDNLSNGINGDRNSLVLNEDGTVQALQTPVSSVMITDQDGKQDVYRASLKRNPLNIDTMIPIPLKLSFSQNRIEIKVDDQIEKSFDLKDVKVHVTQILDYMQYISCGNCSECSGCSGH